MKNDIEHHALFGLECTITLMGRLMYLNDYGDMIELYNSNKLVSELLNFYGPANYEIVELVYSLSKEYLNHLTNN